MEELVEIRKRQLGHAGYRIHLAVDKEELELLEELERSFRNRGDAIRRAIRLLAKLMEQGQ